MPVYYIACMEPSHLPTLQNLVYEYHRLFIDRYGPNKDLPEAFYSTVDLIEKHYGVLFNVRTWKWEEVKN